MRCLDWGQKPTHTSPRSPFSLRRKIEEAATVTLKLCLAERTGPGPERSPKARRSFKGPKHFLRHKDLTGGSTRGTGAPARRAGDLTHLLLRASKGKDGQAAGKNPRWDVGAKRGARGEVDKKNQKRPSALLLLRRRRETHPREGVHLSNVGKTYATNLAAYGTQGTGGR